MGLGLIIVKQISNLMNGTVEVTSEYNKGTKFVLSFPIQQHVVRRKTDGCRKISSFKEEGEKAQVMMLHESLQNADVLVTSVDNVCNDHLENMNFELD